MPVSAVSVDGICCVGWATASSVLPLIMDALWNPQGRQSFPITHFLFVVLLNHLVAGSYDESQQR